LEQSKLNQCLFVGSEVICIVYTNNLIFWSKDTIEINNSALQLHELGVDLKQEDDAMGFLGVTLEQDTETGLLKMKQTDGSNELSKHLVWTMGVPNGSTLFGVQVIGKEYQWQISKWCF
jgi:hypothetical protein